MCGGGEGGGVDRGREGVWCNPLSRLARAMYVMTNVHGSVSVFYLPLPLVFTETQGSQSIQFDYSKLVYNSI